MGSRCIHFSRIYLCIIYRQYGAASLLQDVIRFQSPIRAKENDMAPAASDGSSIGAKTENVKCKYTRRGVLSHGPYLFCTLTGSCHQAPDDVPAHGGTHSATGQQHA